MLFSITFASSFLHHILVLNIFTVCCNFLNQFRFFLLQDTNDDSIRASEVLLELLVKIAAHPSQWEQVHNLLRK